MDVERAIKLNRFLEESFTSEEAVQKWLAQHYPEMTLENLEQHDEYRRQSKRIPGRPRRDN